MKRCLGDVLPWAVPQPPRPPDRPGFILVARHVITGNGKILVWSFEKDTDTCAQSSVSDLPLFNVPDVLEVIIDEQYFASPRR